MKPDHGGSLEIIVADVSLSVLRESCGRTGESNDVIKLDGLVCCAGVLLNEKTMTSENVETTFASHLAFGSCLLTKELLPLLRRRLGRPPARVVYTSSGGMYNSKFPGVAACVDPIKYDGQFAYVYAKRGQVLLAERLAAQEPRVAFVSSHPGWTRTAAVGAAYGSPTARRPTAWQGAEGQCWLCVVDRDRLENGGFYLDRCRQCWLCVVDRDRLGR